MVNITNLGSNRALAAQDFFGGSGRAAQYGRHGRKPMLWWDVIIRLRPQSNLCDSF